MTHRYRIAALLVAAVVLATPAIAQKADTLRGQARQIVPPEARPQVARQSDSARPAPVPTAPAASAVGRTTRAAHPAPATGIPATSPAGRPAKSGSRTPNLTVSYTPTGWDDRIVASGVTGTTTHGALTAGLPTYVDLNWDNSGSDVTVSFLTGLFLDGTQIGTWSNADLPADYYSFVLDFEIPVTVTAGTHTLMVCTDLNNDVAESDETDNCYQLDFTWQAGQPNLSVGYTPSGWDYPIVPSHTTGTFTVGTLSAGQPTYVDVSTGISDTEITADFQGKLYLDGTQVFTVNWNGLPEGHYGWYHDIALTGITAGTHTLRFCVDPDNTLAESDEADNCYERDFTWQSATAQPNLVADYTPSGWDYPIVPAPSPGGNTVGTLTAGQPVYVDYAYINRDADITETFHSTLYLDGSEVYTSYIDELAQDFFGYREDLELTVSVTPGDHTLTLCVDVNGVIAESDESDNCYSRTFTWEAPTTLPNLIADYTPTDWDYPIVPSQLTGTTTVGTLIAGSTTFVDVAFVNRFADITTSFSGTLYVDGSAVGTWTWDPLPQNHYGYVLDIELTQSLTAGDHTLRFCIDVNGVIAESNESDNCYERTFTWTQVNPLTAPTPLSPGTSASPGPEISDLLPTFTWTTVAEATQYEFNMRDLNTGSLVVSGATTQNTSLTLTSGQELVAGHSYRWDVTSQRGGEEATSIDFHFRAAAGAPVIAVTPGSMALSMEQGETASRSLSIGNSGTADLTWSVSVSSVGTPNQRVAPPERRLHPVTDKIHPAVRRGAAKHPGGLIPVIVRLAVPFAPEMDMGDSVVRKQRAEVASAQDAVLSTLSRLKTDAVQRFTTTPFLALRIEAAALDRLAASPAVAEVLSDAVERPFLAESTELIGADVAWAAGATGSGQAVAVLDTGVDAAHPFLSGKVVHEACFSTNYAVEQRVSACPSGAETQLGTGSGAACTGSDDCDHGTHVAGIAAGSGSSFSGVAPGADVIAIQVFHIVNDSGSCTGGSAPCARVYTSDLMQAMEHVYELRSSLNISAVNLSLGGGLYESACDSDPRKAVIDNLRAAGIATVVASGNDDQFNAISAPACISSAISVGSTTKQDAVADYSNSANFLSILAPGSSIRSSVVGGGYEYYWGTSMAAPHVAGAWAVFLSANPGYSVSNVLQTLSASGEMITDTRNGVQTPRVNLGAAIGGSAPWITASPLSGTTPPGSSSVVSLSINTSGLEAGTHEAVVAVSSNSASTPIWQVPVLISVVATLQLRTVQVESPGCSGETIQVSPSDQNGFGSGSTPFSRSFEAGAAVTLTAPATCSSGSTVFSAWQVDGSQVSTDLSLAVTASADHTVSAVYETPACPVCGDASGNGTVSGFDASLILQHSAGLEPSPFYGCAADVSGNGSVTAFDASVVLRYNVGLADLTCTSGKGAPASARPGVLALTGGSSVSLEEASVPVYSFELLLPGALATGSEVIRRSDLPGDWQLLTHFTPGGLRLTAAGLTPLSEGTLLELGLDPGAFGEARLNEGDWLLLGAGVSDLPNAIALSQNYPNPFNPTTGIGFELPEAGPVRLSVFDMLGREVRVLADGRWDAGRHEIRLEASDLPSGMYLYRLAAGGAEITRTMVLLK